VWNQTFTIQPNPYSIVYIEVLDEDVTTEETIGFIAIEPIWFDPSRENEKIEKELDIIYKGMKNGLLKVTFTKMALIPQEPSNEFKAKVKEYESIPKENLFDMVFQGGGAKGIAYGGVLRSLDHFGIKPRRIIGTSAGAITALSVALHYSPQELYDTLTEKNPTNGEMIFSSWIDIHKHMKPNTDFLKYVQTLEKEVESKIAGTAKFSFKKFVDFVRQRCFMYRSFCS